MILTTVRMIDMRILLINPNYSEPIYEDGSHTTLVPNFPIGLGYVASYIREYGDHEIEVLDASKSATPLINDVPQRNKYFTSNQLEIIQSEFYSRFLKSRLKAILKNTLNLIRKMRNLKSMKYTLKLGMVYSRMAVYSFSRKRQKDMTRRLFLKDHKNAEYTAR